MAKAGIENLSEVVAALPLAERDRFGRLYGVDVARGELRVPPPLREWVTDKFGSVDAVREQQIIRLTNLITEKETLFNPLRKRRPVDFREKNDPEEILAQAAERDVFADVARTTTEDPFGRITGKHCVTAGNIAKYDGWHGVIIFNEFNPLCFTRAHISDYLDVGRAWADKVVAADAAAQYFFMIWNCLWRAGASLHHGHAQVMMARRRHYGRVERLRRTATGYRARYATNYFDDIFGAHRAVGAALSSRGVKIMAHLTPVKDNEVILMADGLDESFKDCLYEVLACFRDELGIASFNLALTMPPLRPTTESWADFPVIAWLVDRGDVRSRVSDIGGMELYGSSVVTSDPLALAASLRNHFDRNGCEAAGDD